MVCKQFHVETEAWLSESAMPTMKFPVCHLLVGRRQYRGQMEESLPESPQLSRGWAQRFVRFETNPKQNEISKSFVYLMAS
jgi:hypothetical protein